MLIHFAIFLQDANLVFFLGQCNLSNFEDFSLRVTFKDANNAFGCQDYVYASLFERRWGIFLCV